MWSTPAPPQLFKRVVFSWQLDTTFAGPLVSFRVAERTKKF